MNLITAKKDLFKSIQNISILIVMYLIICFILSTYEYTLLYEFLPKKSQGINLEFQGLIHKTLDILFISLIYFPIFFFLSLKMEKIIFYFTLFILLLYVFLQLITIQYFGTLFVLLDEALYQYSLGDIIKSSDLGNSSTNFYIVIAFLILIVYLVLKYKEKLKIPGLPRNSGQ